MATFSKRSLEGALLIDNRHAPPPDPIQVAAFEAKHGPLAGADNRTVFESATITCAHCQAIVVLNPNRSRARHYCSKCDSYVCDAPTCVVECSPLNAVFDRLHTAAAKMR